MYLNIITKENDTKKKIKDKIQKSNHLYRDVKHVI